MNRPALTSAMGGPLAYFLTIRCYGTWLHGDPRGSVDRSHHVYGTPVLDPDERRERAEFRRLKHAPVALDDARRTVVDRTIRAVCAYRGWVLHALNVRTNHVHAVVTTDGPPEKARNDLKSWTTRRMVEAGLFPPKTKAWSTGGSRRYLWTAQDLEEACRYVRECQGPDLISPPNGPLPGPGDRPAR